MKAAELCVLFLLGPFLYVILDPGQGVLFPALWLWCMFCLAVLLADRSFPRQELWNSRSLHTSWRPILLRFAVLGGLMTLGVWLLMPDRLFDLPRHKPGLWLVIMIFYPLASVYPQEVIFRAFFFHRYAALFKNPAAMILASAVVFGWVHIIFGSWVSVVLTLIGGIMFAATYARSRSVAAASFEHALYGCLVFTIGLNDFFYTGAAQ